MLTLIAILSLISWRITRFVVSDTLIEETRARLFRRLTREPQRPLRTKLLELLSCPYCFSVWSAAAVTVATDVYMSVPAPVAVWLATAAGTMVVWRWVES